jgi:hypothetical protein
MPKRKPSANTSIENILESHGPEVRALVERLRKIIREAVPDATESAHPVWHSIGYRHPESGYFCGIFPQADRVDLAFEFGVLLPDPGGLLEGDGKQVRYVRIRRDRDIRVRALKKLLLAAIDLPASRDVKLGLIRSSAKPILEDD